MLYLWIKALHIIAVISWMAGMLYLPRLFVYHVEKPESGETFKIMERRLLRYIMTPAMIAAWVFGIAMIALNPAVMSGGWLHVKLICVLILSGLHGYFAKTVKSFANDANTKTSKFYRIINEAPTVLMILIVIMAVVKPF
jgi:putative membrane protein